MDPKVDQLLTLLEEGARASNRSVKRFIEPMQGTLRRAQNRRHQIIFGRRGSGKSSLLYKTAHDLTEKGHPVAYVDLEPFKGHQYPDVLISVLLATFKKLVRWISEKSLEKGPRDWRTAGLTRKKHPKQIKRANLLASLEQTIQDLNRQLYLDDASKLVSTVEQDSSQTRHKKATAAIPILDNKIEAELANEQTKSSKFATTEESKRSKIDYLHRKILEYQQFFASLSELTDSDPYLFLDDLYHIVRADQARLLDYFHRIAKGQHLWLKIGTIKHRSTWYQSAPQPTGLKTSDDADDINLDLTLEKFSLAQQFLGSILDAYIQEAATPSRDALLSAGGIERLVIASGGVPRDFLALFRRAISEARERLTKNPSHPRGTKLVAEDVNMAAGEYGDSKKEEFKKDSFENEAQLSEALDKICRFCLQRNRSNIFLIEQNSTGPHYDQVQELIDLRLVHHVKSRVTVSGEPGKAYRALLLDFSQYTGARRHYDVEMIEFWKGDRETLRKTRLIYDPCVSLADLEREIQELHAKPQTSASSSEQRQGQLSL